MNRLNHQDRLSIFGCEGALRSTNLLSETGGLLLLHPHMHSQTLNKTNSTNSSRYPQYSTLYHFSTFLQHHVITKTQEKKKIDVPGTSDSNSKVVIQIQYRKFASNIGTPRSVYHRAISNGTTPKTLDSTSLQ